MKVYISGPVTGMPDFNRPAFDHAEDLLSARGYEVINPLRYTEYKPEKTWQEYMREDIALLLKCDAIHMLEDWRDSKGAVLEYTIAHSLGYVFV